MATIWTLGHPSKRTRFSYRGSVATGVTLLQSGAPNIDPSFFRAALDTFRGMAVKGGFSEDNPSQGGFGEWVQEKSADKKLNGRRLTPRHGSFIAAILCSEAGVKSHLRGMAVWLEFPK
jgi:hypothetical protein